MRLSHCKKYARINNVLYENGIPIVRFKRSGPFIDVEDCSEMVVNYMSKYMELNPHLYERITYDNMVNRLNITQGEVSAEEGSPLRIGTDEVTIAIICSQSNEQETKANLDLILDVFKFAKIADMLPTEMFSHILHTVLAAQQVLKDPTNLHYRVRLENMLHTINLATREQAVEVAKIVPVDLKIIAPKPMSGDDLLGDDDEDEVQENELLEEIESHMKPGSLGAEEPTLDEDDDLF